MNLTRKQEKILIDLGLKQILDNYFKPKKRGPYKKAQKSTKSAAERAAISARMKAMWAKRKKHGKTV